jgi:hypothetical protein
MSMERFLELKEQNSNFAGRSTRVVLDTDLTIVGLFGLQDPLRSITEHQLV